MRTKRIKITSDKGFFIFDAYGSASVTFLAELPKSAVVDAVKVNGEYLDDIVCTDSGDASVSIIYPRTKAIDKHRIVANVRFEGDVSNNAFYHAAHAYEFTEFEVEYHENAVTEL